VRATSRVLAVRGQILPSTLANVTLSARTEDKETIHGEHNITERGCAIEEVYLQPGNVQANPEVIRAILNADLIILGPGSLFTSVLPNLLVDGIRRAVAVSSALKVYVCNVATQHGETDSFTVSDHFRTLEKHAGHDLFDYVLANSNVQLLAGVLALEPVQVDDLTLTAPTSSPPTWSARRIVTTTIPRSSPTLSCASTSSDRRWRSSPRRRGRRARSSCSVIVGA
jgi:uncharacterized cofD-like protein